MKRKIGLNPCGFKNVRRRRKWRTHGRRDGWQTLAKSAPALVRLVGYLIEELLWLLGN